LKRVEKKREDRKDINGRGVGCGVKDQGGSFTADKGGEGGIWAQKLLYVKKITISTTPLGVESAKGKGST